MASFCNFWISSSTSFTTTPPFFFNGSVDSKIFTLLVPRLKDARSTYSMGAFLAFIIMARGAILGTFNLKSQVMTAGPVIFSVSSPVSTSLVTFIYLPLISTLDANVACGHPSKPAKIWPVWLQSSSTAALLKIYIVCRV